MSDSSTPAPTNASSGSEQDASSTAPSVPATNTVDPFTVLFNAVEVANRRGAYSLKESGVISRALDMVRNSLQPPPAASAGADAAASSDEAAPAASE